MTLTGDSSDEDFRTNAPAAYAWVMQHMPDECAQALANFVHTNPRMDGVDWWTAMDALRDSDTGLAIIEPLVERTPGWGTLHVYIALTLLYSTPAFSQEYDDDKRFIVLRATIDNNSRY